jgi:type IV fimbrial biogenesis protein FimT
MTLVFPLRAAKVYQKQIAGFTLVEVMVVISIVAVLASFALPSMRQFVVKTKISGIANDIVGSLNFARSEALRRGQTVIVCPRANPTSQICGNTADWANGWIVCADKSSTSNRCSAGDDFLRIRDPIAAGYVVTKNGTTFLRFNADGTLSATSPGSIHISSPDSGDLLLERSVCIARTGRAQVRDWSGGNTVC